MHCEVLFLFTSCFISSGVDEREMIYQVFKNADGNVPVARFIGVCINNLIYF